MVQGRRWVLKHHFDGLPKRQDFELVEEELPALKDALQVLSVDSFWEVYIKIWFGQVVEDPLENNFWC